VAPEEGAEAGSSRGTSVTAASPEHIVIMGRIGAPHGVRGAFKVKPESADPGSLSAYPEWWLRHGDDAWISHRVQAVREHGEWLVAEVSDVHSREAAGVLRGAAVGVPRASLPALADGEYYEADLVGTAVVNREGIELGRLQDFLVSGAHPIARLIGPDGVERLIPWVRQYIDNVDMAGRRINVDWPLDT
jgi:16S rRNA processing protein RimM